jgi:hypothetical protein
MGGSNLVESSECTEESAAALVITAETPDGLVGASSKEVIAARGVSGDLSHGPSVPVASDDNGVVEEEVVRVKGVATGVKPLTADWGVGGSTM